MNNEMTGTTAMKEARADSGYVTKQACENISALQELWQNGDSSQVLVNDNSMIRQFAGVFAWYAQMKAEGKTLPDDVEIPGYNPETQSVLKVDDPENCQRYRECYVDWVVPQAAKTIIEHLDKQTPDDMEAMKPDTVNAFKALLAGARKVTNQKTAQ